MALFGPTLLLVAIAGCLASERYLAELTSYTIAVIQHLSLGQPGGTFECVVVDLQRSNPFDTVLGDVLRSPKLDRVVKFVIGSNFEGDPEWYPRDPSLVLVHAGASYDNVRQIPNNMAYTIFQFSAKTKMLVFVNLDYRGTHFHCINELVAGFRFSRVAFLGTNQKLILRTSNQGQIQHLWQHFPSFENLLRSNVQNMHGSAIKYTTIDPTFNTEHIAELIVHFQWISEMAKHLNATLRRMLNPCKEDKLVNLCFKKFMSRNDIDITLDRLFIAANNTMDLIYLKDPETHVILVPRGRTLNVFELFKAPFTTEAWILLLLIIISLEVLSFILPSQFKNDPALFLICGLERYDLHKAKRWEKMILFAFIIFFFLMTNAYETKIISMMASKPTHRSIKTVEELVEAGIPTKANLNHIMILDLGLLNKTLQNATEDLSSMDGVSAYLATRTKSEIFLPIYHFDYNLQRTSYVIMAETLGLLIGALQTSDRNPLQGVLEASHATFVEGGLLDHYTERMKMKYFYHRRKTQPQAENGRTLLGIDDLAPAWIALGVGFVASVLLFSCELQLDFISKNGTQ